MKYTESQDLFNKNITNLFDAMTNICIGQVSKIDNHFVATPFGVNKPSAKFNYEPLAKGYISACIYGRNYSKSKCDAKQTSLTL